MTAKTYIIRAGDTKVTRNCIEDISHLPANEHWKVRVESFKRNRTLAQNSLMWRWHTEAATEFGETKESEHHEFKRHHLLPVLLRDDEDGRLIDMWGMMRYAADEIREKFIGLLSTTLLNTKQFTECLNEYDMVTAQKGLVFSRRDDTYHEAMAARMDMRRSA